VVVEWGSDEWWWRSSGGGIEGSDEGNLSAVAVARAVELQWIGGGVVSGLAVDWWWQGRGCWW
jgi:hypothetical protein